MRVIALSTLKAFLNRSPGYADAREPVMAWYRLVRDADWATPADVKRSIRSSSILKDGRAVFNIAGNKYRIVVWITMHIEWSTSGSLVRTVNMMQLMQRLYEGSYEYRADQIPA